MPNWCDSDLWVTAKPTNKEERKSFPGVIKRFVETAEGSVGCLDMNKFIPYPKRFSEPDKKCRKVREEWESLNKEQRSETGFPEIKDGYNNGGYDWCIENWGVKWNFSNPRVIKSDKVSVLYNFQTPWGPPGKVIIRMSEMFPQLEFKLKYYECGMGYQGVFIVKAGTIVKDENKKYIGWRGG